MSKINNKKTNYLISLFVVASFIVVIIVANYSVFAFGNKETSPLLKSKTTVSEQTKNNVVDFNEGFADLAEILLPTVVNVSTTHKVQAQKRPPMPNFGMNSPFEDMFRDFFEQYENIPQNQPSEVSSLGSGFVIDAEKGYIVTNNHVIDGADDIKVILHDDTNIDAVLIGHDKKTDLAVLQIKTKHKLTAAKWGDSSSARVGNWILAIGNPFGLGGTVTTGIISARQRNINAGPYDDFIQTDASINRGNSGGPMFNVKGDVIGVNTAIFSPSGGSVGIGFAVPANLAKNVVKQLIKYGQTKRGWLGVRIQEVTEDIADSLGMKEKMGALVSSATKDGPASKGGIKSGDVIIKFDGKPISEMRQLPLIVAETDVGRTVTVLVWRDGKENKVKVRLGELEKAEENGLVKSASKTHGDGSLTNAIELKELGVFASVINDNLRKQYKIDKLVSGVVITKVLQESPAADKGLREGDVIVEADRKVIVNVKSLQGVLKSMIKKKKTSILLLVSRADNLRFVGIRLKQK